jgi:hypothetical protein
MTGPRKSFGRMDPTIASRRGAEPPPGGAGPAVDYDWLTQPLRDGAAAEPPEQGLGQQLSHLMSDSPYRRWLWFGLGVVVLGVIYVGVVGNSLFGSLGLMSSVAPPSGVEDAVAAMSDLVAIPTMDVRSADADAGAMRLGGTLVNDGDQTITAVTLRIIVEDCAGDPELGDCGLVYEGDVEVPVEGPAGRRTSFTVDVDTSDARPLRGTGRVSYMLLEVETE